ncbi:hypothetical protein [Polyangium jinanense]|uniref:Uncharacterized protein n=1 Tax=Polyangium jinanense TaxID=2829994 RepID=A0A9X3WZE8_9BACT|nr:hypothetical protein [Polyangium jinanense]MDC3980020.1 hypothetical protein [Polyangium jinanense]
MSNEDELNPYEAPKETKTTKRPKKKKAAEDDAPHDPSIDAIVYSLQKTRPWISLFGTLSYIGAVGLVVFGLYTMTSTSTSRAIGDYGAIAFIVYLILAILYAVVGSRLFRYRDSINQVIATDGRLDFIATAIERQREFWAFVGMMTVVLLGLYALIIGGSLLFLLPR